MQKKLHVGQPGQLWQCYYSKMKFKEQEELLEKIISKYPISAEVVEAYKKCPRHKFVNIHYPMEEMYGDYPLTLYADSEYVSTISQPSFVLLMLDMLELKPFHKVIEVGAGSGWNAALMSCLVDKVVSIEIIPTLADQARERLHHLGFHNVNIVTGDGAHGFLPEAPYDIGIFTAGATDLPKAYHDQIKTGGRLLFVLKTFEVDLLLLLQKKEDHFEEISRLHCSFVPMKGEKKADLSFQIQTEGKFKIYRNEHEGDRDSIFSTT